MDNLLTSAGQADWAAHLIYIRNTAGVIAHALHVPRHMEEDAIAQAMLRSVSAVPRYDSTKGEYRHFLKIHIRGAIIDSCRKQGYSTRHTKVRMFSFDPFQTDEGQMLETAYFPMIAADEFADVKSIVRRAVAMLPARSREIIELYFYKDLSMREIAERFKFNESRCSQIVQASLRAMRATLELAGITRLGDVL